MKNKLLKKQTLIWNVKLFLFLCLVLQSTVFLLIPVIKNIQIQNIGHMQQREYKQIIEDLTPSSRRNLTQYEKKYNKYLRKKIIDKNFNIARPSEEYYRQTKGTMGFLSGPVVGLKNTTIGYDSSHSLETPFVQQYLSSLPENSNKMTCILIRLRNEWQFQNLVSVLKHVNKDDSLFFESHHGKEEFKVLENRSYTVRYKDYKTFFEKEGKYFIIQFHSPLTGEHEIIMKKISDNTEKKMIIRSQYISYSIGVIMLLGVTVFVFVTLVFTYRHTIDKFQTGKERVRHTTRKNLYLLLQITKAYLLVIGLASIIFLVFIVYTYGFP